MAQVAGNPQNLTWSWILSSKCVCWDFWQHSRLKCSESRFFSAFFGGGGNSEDWSLRIEDSFSPPILCNLCHPGSSAVIVEKIYLGTPGMSREAGGSDQRARDRSLPGNKIVFQLLSFVGVGGARIGEARHGNVKMAGSWFLVSLSFLNLRLPVVSFSTLFMHKKV